MAQASGVAVQIDLERVPLAPGVAAVPPGAGREADVLAATGGEDYELIVALDPEAAGRLATELDVPLTPVGAVVAGPPGRLTVRRRGVEVALPRLGWEHGA
jgi:thiamine-monophosphate kinase